MSYSLFWRSPALSFVQKQTPITVPAGAVVSNAASLRFTGKGATNYGKIQQENLLRLLENFAGDTEPAHPTVGQTWYDTSASVLKVCINTAPGPVVWGQLNSIQVTGVGEPAPTPASLGDTWFSQTGSASGILYLYTGLGRYPATNWNAIGSGYWPAAAGADLRVILNAAAFGAPNTNYGEVYIHGSSGGVPADVAGSILLDGVPTPIPAGYAATDLPVTDGLMVVDPTGTMVTASGAQKYFVVRCYDDGRWFYDNNETLVEFTPVSAMYAIGVCTAAEQDDNSPPGITAATVWAEARRLTNITQAPAVLANGAIGGWEQIWPAVETHGGRLEYEYMYGQLAKLIGDPIAFGGSNAEGKSVQFLTNFKALDASLQRAYQTFAPTDVNVLANAASLNTLKVSPNSQDWDALLAACRYAVNRLELPEDAVSDIGVYPFVQDGRIGNPALSAYTDSRALPVQRLVLSRASTITLLSQYQETSNILRAAINNRYLARGVLGASGVRTALPSATTTNQASYTAPAASMSGTVSTGLGYQFNYTNPDLEAFFYSGSALQLVMTHTPSGSPTAADTSLQTITSSSGRIRITADSTYVMSTSPTPSLVQAPIAKGFNQLTGPGVVLATLTSGLSTIVIRGIRENGFLVAVYADITAGGAITGSFNVLWSYISDTESYGSPSPTSVYPVPDVNSTGVHRRGSTLFV